MSVTDISPALPALLAWAEDDPDRKMVEPAISDFLAGYRAAAGTECESLTERLIRWYGEIADAERQLGRPDRVAYARRQIARLRFGGTLDLSPLLAEVGS